MKLPIIFKRPSAFIPVAMSVAALSLVLVYVAILVPCANQMRAQRLIFGNYSSLGNCL